MRTAALYVIRILCVSETNNYMEGNVRKCKAIIVNKHYLGLFVRDTTSLTNSLHFYILLKLLCSSMLLLARH